jgi:uncharacterized protein YjdB
MRRALLPGLMVALAGWGCEGTTPSQPGAAAQLAFLPVRASVAPEISMLTITVSAVDIITDLTFNVAVVNGEASDTITVPAGSNRTVTVRGFNAKNIETHRGSKTATLMEGPNAVLSILLSRLTGAQPLTVALGETTVSIVPETVTLRVNETERLVAVVKDEAGDTLDVPVVWATSAPAVATVDQTGLVTGISVGSATISVTHGGLGSGTAQVVTTLQSVSLLLLSDTTVKFVSLGDTVRLSAQRQDPDGSMTEVADLEWTSSDTLIARVDSSGNVTAVFNGVAVITASSGSLKAASRVTVQQEADRIELRDSVIGFVERARSAELFATVYDANGHEFAQANVFWQSGDQRVVTLSPATQGGGKTATVLAIGNGTTSFNVASGQVFLSGSVTVADPLPAVRGAVSALVRGASTVADELFWTGSRDEWGLLDQGYIGNPQNTFSDEAFVLLREASLEVDAAVRVIEDLAEQGHIDGALLGQVLIHRGLVRTLVGELQEDYVGGDGAPIGPTNMRTQLDAAIADFGRAIALLDGDLQTLALGLRARASMSAAIWDEVNTGSLGCDFANAASCVLNFAAARQDAEEVLARVGPGSDWQHRLEYSSLTEASVLHADVNNRGELQWDPSLAELFGKGIGASGRSGAVTLLDPVTGNPDSAVRTMLSQFGSSQYASLTLVSERLLRLIVAEDALAGGAGASSEFEAQVNAIRALDGYADNFVSGGSVSDIEALAHHRRVNTLFMGLRLQDMYRWRILDPRWIETSSAVVAPGTMFPITVSECRTNPAVPACG